MAKLHLCYIWVATTPGLVPLWLVLHSELSKVLTSVQQGSGEMFWTGGDLQVPPVSSFSYLPFDLASSTFLLCHHPWGNSRDLVGLLQVCFVSPPHREKKLKARVQELVSALERLTKSSEIRHQQSAEFVNDLKRANRYNLHLGFLLHPEGISEIAGSQLQGGNGKSSPACPPCHPQDWPSLRNASVPQETKKCSVKACPWTRYVWEMQHTMVPFNSYSKGSGKSYSKEKKKKKKMVFKPTFSQQNWL